MKISKVKKDIIFSKTNNGRCFYCNRKNATDIEHFVSRQKSKDWELDNYIDINDITNLFPSCKSCNSKKRDKCPEDFMKNSWVAWSRWHRCNYRAGLIKQKRYEI